MQHLTKPFFIALILLGLSSMLSACEGFRDFADGPHGETALAANNDPVALRIAESADKASAALRDLARVEQTRRPPAPEPAAIGGDNELNSLITIDWVGGAEELVRNLGTKLKYDVVVTGVAPNVPVIVQIHQRDRTIVEALRNIGDQATQYIDLVVDSRAHKIEVRYKVPEPTQS